MNDQPSPQHPLVSVIIRSMDRPTLREVLDSVAAQTYPNIEVVLVNAKGADHSDLGETCGRFPMRMVGAGDGLRRSRAANLGLENAHGEYLIFLDDDDWFAPKHIEALVACLALAPKAAVAYSGVQTVGGDTPSVFNAPFDAVRLMGANYIPIHAVLFARSLVEQGCRFDEALDVNEDWDFWLQVLRLTSFEHLSEITAFYRVGGDSGISPAGNGAAAKRLTKEPVFEKWKKIWSAAEINALVGYLEDEVANLQHEAAKLQHELAGANQQIGRHERERNRLEQQLADLRVRVQGLLGSSSWRVTAPMRWVGVAVKRILSIGKKVGRRVDRALSLSTKARAVIAYHEWVERSGELDAQVLRNSSQEIEAFPYRPLISVLMPTYNTQVEFLQKAIESVCGQRYPNWELCIADDASTEPHMRQLLEAYTSQDDRIRVEFRAENGHISAASNSALAMARGDYVALLDHDDEFTEDALYWVVRALNSGEKYDIIYSDEDKIDVDGKRQLPFFKPDWSPDLLRAQMYVGHLCVLRRELVNETGGFRQGYEGSQDYDLVLRMSEIGRRICHIPRVLYHWRLSETSTSLDADSKPYADGAGKKALQDHLDRSFGPGRAVAREGAYTFTYDVRFRLPSPRPLVSIIIPTKDKTDLLARCIDSILEKTDYPAFEILVLDNNSVEPESQRYFDGLPQRDSRIRVLPAHFPFNWSRLNNVGVDHAQGDVFVFLNNDTEVISADWIERLAENALRSDIGTVGALLLYEDETIQHAGVVLGMNGWADHVYKGEAMQHLASPFVSPMLPRNVLASTGACLAISRVRFDELGGFDEAFVICGSDVELSLRAHKCGYRNLYTPYVRLYHLESKTRDSHVPKNDFTQSALKYQPYREAGDPYYNPNLAYSCSTPSLAG